jgi:uncharacterized membrane protein
VAAPATAVALALALAHAFLLAVAIAVALAVVLAFARLMAAVHMLKLSALQVTHHALLEFEPDKGLPDKALPILSR